MWVISSVSMPTVYFYFAAQLKVCCVSFPGETWPNCPCCSVTCCGRWGPCFQMDRFRVTPTGWPRPRPRSFGGTRLATSTLVEFPTPREVFAFFCLHTFTPCNLAGVWFRGTSLKSSCGACIRLRKGWSPWRSNQPSTSPVMTTSLCLSLTSSPESFRWAQQFLYKKGIHWLFKYKKCHLQ